MHRGVMTMALLKMEIKGRLRRFRTPYLYPLGWAVITAVLFGIPAIVGAGLAMWCRYTIAGIQ